jgi:GntR family transcriptional regulator
MELTCIDRSGMEPLYYQIQQQLFEGIRSGELKAGDPLPSEQEISVRLGVSRMTVRLAIKSLCELGIVYSKQGKGSFVSSLKLEKNFRQVLSFTEEMVQSGRRPESRPLGFDTVPAEKEVAEALALNSQENVIRLRRVRMADSAPMGIETSYIPERLCPNLEAKFNPRTSLYQTLSARYGIQMAIADEVVEAGLANSEEARLLRIPKGSPVFLFTRTSYVQQGQAVEYVKSTYRADRYKIVNRLVRLNRRFAVQDAKRRA